MTAIVSGLLLDARNAAAASMRTFQQKESQLADVVIKDELNDPSVSAARRGAGPRLRNALRNRSPLALGKSQVFRMIYERERPCPEDTKSNYYTPGLLLLRQP